VEENLARFESMLAGEEAGKAWCLRAKIDMKSNNGTMRDPVLYRANDTPHHRTGTTYKAYPTYDFVCPIVDSIEGVTHALRTSEYADREEQYIWLQAALGLRKVHIHEFSRLNFVFTLLSKRKLAWFADTGKVDGWYDPRFPTVQGVLRRGVTVPALREFILGQGASKRVLDMEWDKFWAINKKHLDPVAPRYTALPAAGLVRLALAGAPPREHRTQPLHAKNADCGVKSVLYTPSVLLDAADAAAIADGEEVTLMKWGNVRGVRRDAGGGGLAGELNVAGDPKTTEKKLTWLPDGDADDTVPFTLVEFDFLIKTPSLDEHADFQAALNPVTRRDTPLLGEPAMRTLQAGDIIQLERRGFVRCDRAYVSRDRPGVLFLIPDGKTRGLANLGGPAA
jgi:glutamyl-tRNA synthetase